MKSRVVLSGFSTAKCIVNVAILVIHAASSKAKSPPWLVPITSQEVPAQVGTGQGRLATHNNVAANVACKAV